MLAVRASPNLQSLERLCLSSHPSFRRAPPRSSFASNTAHRLSTRADLPRGLGPHRDITGLRPRHRGGTQHPASFRPQVFSTSRRFTPQAGLQVCFAPQPRPGPILFRGFSLRAAVLPHRKPLPPCRCRRRTHRLPDVHAIDASASRLCSNAKQRFVRRAMKLFERSLPSSGFMLLQVELLRRWRRLPSVIRS